MKIGIWRIVMIIIRVSLTCGVVQDVRILHGTMDGMTVMERTMKDTSTCSTSRANQVSSQVGEQAQIPVVAIRIQGQGTAGVINTVADNRAIAVTTGSSNNQFASFNVRDNVRANFLAFSFIYPRNIVDEKVKRQEKEFMCVVIRKTFQLVIIGTWEPLDREEACPYSFKADQNIYSIGSLSTENDKPTYFQSYVLQFLINHALSHIHSNVDTKLLGFGKKSVNEVLTKFEELSRC
jgi:hypothetical protein